MPLAPPPPPPPPPSHDDALVVRLADPATEAGGRAFWEGANSGEGEGGQDWVVFDGAVDDAQGGGSSSSSVGRAAQAVVPVLVVPMPAPVVAAERIFDSLCWMPVAP